MTRTLSRPERIAWARLARTPRIGPLTFHRLLARFKSASAALEALPPSPTPSRQMKRALAMTELELTGQAASLPGGYAASSGAAF